MNGQSDIDQLASEIKAMQDRLSSLERMIRELRQPTSLAIGSTMANEIGKLATSGNASIGGDLTLSGYLIGHTGWIKETDTWVYVASNQFKIVGKDVTARFPTGTKIKLTQTSVKYFYVTACALSGSDTLVTVTGGSDYSLANAAIASTYYSYSTRPQGFPSLFAWTPTWTNLTITGSPIYSGLLSVVGRLAFVEVVINPNGGTTASTLNSTYINNLPVTAALSALALVGMWMSTAAPALGYVSISNNGLFTPTWSADGNLRFINTWFYIA
jgi:hypothetical protein